MLVLLLVGATFAWQRAVAFNDRVSTQSALSTSLFGPFSGKDRVNVLLLGYSDDSRPGGYLSDSMNLLSIDPETDTATVIPIPRDLWVEGIAEVPQNMKINEAFRIGYYADGLDYAAELSAKAVTHVTGLGIDGWLSLDFQGFAAMVDAIDGIRLENPRAFAYAWSDEDWLARNFQYSFPAGTLELNGPDALDYARNRYGSVPEEYGDFARLQRQQRVLQAIKAELDGWRAIPKALAVADALQGHLRTSLSVLDLAGLARHLDADQRLEIADALVATTNTLGQYILVVAGQAASDDYAPLHTYIAEQLVAPEPDS